MNTKLKSKPSKKNKPKKVSSRSYTLKEALQCATKYVNKNILEETGGFIVTKGRKSGDRFEFIPIKNKNIGQSCAAYLYSSDEEEFGKEVVLDKLLKGYSMYGSFHSHPTFRANPSSIDLANIFPGHAHNYIYSICDEDLKEYTIQERIDVGVVPYTTVLPGGTRINWYKHDVKL